MTEAERALKNCDAIEKVHPDLSPVLDTIRAAIKAQEKPVNEALIAMADEIMRLNDVLKQDKPRPDFEAAFEILGRLCREGKLRMTIPVRETDEDVILYNALNSAKEKPAKVTVKEFNDLIDPQMPSFNNIGNLLLNRFPNGLKIIEGARDGNTETAT